MPNAIKSRKLDTIKKNAGKFLLRTVYFFLLLTQICFAQWVPIKKMGGRTGNHVQSLAISGNSLFVGTITGTVFLSTDNGISWSELNYGLAADRQVSCLAIKGTNIFAGIVGAGVTFLSTNYGESWTADIYYEPLRYIQDRTNIFDDVWRGGVFLSTNNGTSWTEVNSGLTNNDIISLAISGTNLFAGTLGGVFLSTDNGTSWTEVNSGLTNKVVMSLAISGTNLFAGTLGGVFLSTDNGTSWTEVNSGLTNKFVSALAVIGTNIFAGTFGFDTGVYLSTNNGTSWTEVNSGLTSKSIFTLIVNEKNIFAGSDYGGVSLSTDNGESWTAVIDGLNPKTTIKSLLASKTDLFAAGAHGMWRRPLIEMIGATEKLIPIGFSLAQNYPNPFNAYTVIHYLLPVRCEVELKIYDILGSEVTTLVNEQKAAGEYEIIFDASLLASGVYIYRLQAGTFENSKKMILVK